MSILIGEHHANSAALRCRPLPLALCFEGGQIIISEIVTGLIGFLCGTYAGHRLAVWRDRRKEFNDLAQPLFDRLEQQRMDIEAGRFPGDANSFGRESFISLRSLLSKKDRRKLDEAVKRYEEAKRVCGHYEKGIYTFDHPERLGQAIKALQAFVLRK